MNQPAAGKTRQIKDHGLDPVIPCRRADRMGYIAGAILVDRGLAGKQHLQRVRSRKLFHHRSVQFEQQRTVSHQSRTGPRGQRGIQHEEKQHHEQHDQPVLDADEQMPDLTGENHARTPLPPAWRELLDRVPKPFGKVA